LRKTNDCDVKRAVVRAGPVLVINDVSERYRFVELTRIERDFADMRVVRYNLVRQRPERNIPALDCVGEPVYVCKVHEKATKDEPWWLT
jgi:hypothetical protein